MKGHLRRLKSEAERRIEVQYRHIPGRDGGKDGPHPLLEMVVQHRAPHAAPVSLPLHPGGNRGQQPVYNPLRLMLQNKKSDHGFFLTDFSQLLPWIPETRGHPSTIPQIRFAGIQTGIDMASFHPKCMFCDIPQHRDIGCIRKLNGQNRVRFC